MRRVFISGALNSDSIGSLENARRMILTGYEVRKLGFRIYVPVNDILLSLVGGCFEHSDYLDYDLKELEYCDALLLVDNPNNGDSKGVKGEIKKAQELGIPIFRDIIELKKVVGRNSE